MLQAEGQERGPARLTGAVYVLVNGAVFGGVVSTTGAGTCGGNCQSYVQGFFAHDAQIIGIPYQVGLGANRISGVAAFARQ